jgi:hypothetical protein
MRREEETHRGTIGEKEPLKGMIGEQSQVRDSDARRSQTREWEEGKSHLRAEKRRERGIISQYVNRSAGGSNITTVIHHWI